MRPLLIGSTLALMLALPAAAQEARELSAPIVAFTPVIKANADALELSTAQRADLANWLATMPAKRKALEAEALGARAALRAAIVAGAPQDARRALAEKIGALEAKLVMARSGCTDHWRETLTETQFAKMLELAAM